MRGYAPKDLIEVEPIDRKEELLEFLKPYNPIVRTCDDEGYEYLDIDLECISVTNNNGDVMDIELDGYWNLYFRCGHTHYWSYESGWEALLEDLKQIFANKLAMISYKVNNEWRCSGFLESSDDKTDFIENHVRNEWNKSEPYYRLKKGDEIIIKTEYWDVKDDKEYKIIF